MRRKDETVELKLHSMLAHFLWQIDDLYKSWDSELTITSGSELTAKHGYASLHYATPCQAVDTRIWQNHDNSIPPPIVQQKAIQKVAAIFCEEERIPISWIEIILEGNHMHIEYQPKRPETFN